MSLLLRVQLKGYSRRSVPFQSGFKVELPTRAREPLFYFLEIENRVRDAVGVKMTPLLSN